MMNMIMRRSVVQLENKDAKYGKIHLCTRGKYGFRYTELHNCSVTRNFLWTPLYRFIFFKSVKICRK